MADRSRHPRNGSLRRATFLVTLAFALSATATTSEPGPAVARVPTSPFGVSVTEPSPVALLATQAPEPVVPKGAFAARPIARELTAWSSPRGEADPVGPIPTTNPFGQPLSFRVIGHERDTSGVGWIRIETGTEPNGASAWVRASDVRLVPMRERIVVDLSERRLRRYVDGELRDRLTVAIGSPSTPTVPGTYFVWARIRDYKPSIYGRFVLGLSGFSEVVNFGPTPGRLAIHGTADPSDKGRAVSLGCVRVLNRELTPLWRVPMGTPVVIRP